METQTEKFEFRSNVKDHMTYLYVCGQDQAVVFRQEHESNRGSCSSDVFNGVDIAVSCPILTVSAQRRFLEENEDYLESLLEKYETVWSGSNRGQWGEDIMYIQHELERRLCKDLESDDLVYLYTIDDFDLADLKACDFDFDQVQMLDLYYSEYEFDFGQSDLDELREQYEAEHAN